MKSQATDPPVSQLGLGYREAELHAPIHQADALLACCGHLHSAAVPPCSKTEKSFRSAAASRGENFRAKLDQEDRAEGH